MVIISVVCYNDWLLRAAYRYGFPAPTFTFSTIRMLDELFWQGFSSRHDDRYRSGEEDLCVLPSRPDLITQGMCVFCHSSSELYPYLPNYRHPTAGVLSIAPASQRTSHSLMPNVAHGHAGYVASHERMLWTPQSGAYRSRISVDYM